MKKKFMEDKKFRLIAMLLITVIIVTGFSLAWFIARTEYNKALSASNFTAEPVCYFEGSGNTEGVADKYIENGLIVLSTDLDDENYIGNFRVNVKYKGDGAGYLRVKMVHEYSINGVSTQHPANIPYEADVEKWYDNRGNDYCFYYMEEIDADSNANGNTLEFITGINDVNGDIASIADGVEIRVAVETDMVQINRYPQVWGIDKLPWK